MKRTLLYLAALAGLTACVQDLKEDVVVTPDEDNGPTLSINASMDEIQTRVITEDGLTFKFEAGTDKVGVFFYNENLNNPLLENVAFKAGAADEDGKFEFTMEDSEYNISRFLTQRGTQIFGYAPYTEADSSIGGGIEGEVTRSGESLTLTRNFNVPTQQNNATDAKGVAKYYTVVAKPASPAENADGNFDASLSFSGIFSLIKFTVRNEDSGDLAVSCVKFTVGENEALTGLFTADLEISPKFAENNEYKLTPVEGRANNYIEMTFDSPVTLANGEELVLYGVVNSGTYAAGVKMEVMADSEGRSYIYSATKTSETVITRQKRDNFRLTLRNGEGQLQPSEGIEVINNVDDLKALAAAVNGGDNKSGKTVVLTTDLDLENEAWTPIEGFSGNFEGGNHTISNLKVATEKSANAGLFGLLKGTVKDLTLKNVNISGQKATGALAGYGDNAVIENCHVISGTIISTPHLLDSGKYDDGNNVGGIIGLAQNSYKTAVINNCSVKDVTITAYRDLGGIVGKAYQNTLTITNNTLDNVDLICNRIIENGEYCEDKAEGIDIFVGRFDKASADLTTNSANDVTITIHMTEGLDYVKTATVDEYRISSANGLVYANEKLFAQSGLTYVLTDDIDMAGVENYISNLKGTFTFDGNNKTISNWSTKGFSLLVHGSPNCTIKNLTLVNCKVDQQNGTNNGAGMIGGWLDASGSVNVDGCKVIGGSVTGTNYAAAIIGYSSLSTTSIANCSVSGTTINGHNSSAGIIGQQASANTTITDCSVSGCAIKNDGASDDDWRVGCIAGTVNGSRTLFTGNTASDNTLSQEPIVDRTSGYIYNKTENNLWGRYVTNKGTEFIVDGRKIIADGFTLEVASNTYYVSNANGMRYFGDEVNVRNNSFSGKTVKLESNIDLENRLWTPVGQTGATQFTGVFDGQEYTISNLSINNPAGGQNCSSGLFGWIPGATIKNLTIQGGEIIAHHYTGGIAGYLELNATISNCTVKELKISLTHLDDAACGDKAGAIVGIMNSGCSVINCSAENCEISAARDAGQLIGRAFDGSIITGCSATDVTVTANTEGCTDGGAGTKIGGLIGDDRRTNKE